MYVHASVEGYCVACMHIIVGWICVYMFVLIVCVHVYVHVCVYLHANVDEVCGRNRCGCCPVHVCTCLCASWLLLLCIFLTITYFLSQGLM